MLRRVFGGRSLALAASRTARGAVAVPTLPARAFATTSALRCYNYEAFHTATVQKPAPQFQAKGVVNGELADLSLSDYKGKWVVLLFYPLDFTFVCPTEINAFSDRVKEFEKLGAVVLGISVDSEYSHLAWTNLPRSKGGIGRLAFPLVADLTKEISRDYGVLLEEDGVALRGLFILDSQHVVRHITINDLPVGRNVDEVLRVLQAFQHNEKFPDEKLPCGWTPGKRVLDKNKSDEYFAAEDQASS